MDPITPLSKQELENRGWQMTTVENPTPDPGPTVVQQMRLEFATTKAYKGSEGYPRSLRFKIYGVAEADLPNIRLEFGRFIKTRHTPSSGLDRYNANPESEYADTDGNHYCCRGFIVPNPKRQNSIAISCSVYDEGAVGTRNTYFSEDGIPHLIARTKVSQDVNSEAYSAVNPNPDIRVPNVTVVNDKALTLADFIAPFIFKVDSSTDMYIGASHFCGHIRRTPTGSFETKNFRFVKCGFRLVNIVTGDVSPILEFLPVVQLMWDGPSNSLYVKANVSWGSFNPKRGITAAGYDTLFSYVHP